MKVSPVEFIQCPVEIAFTHIGKKWTINILRDMFRGTTRFSDFLVNNPKLSTRMLSQRLQDLEEDGLIVRKVIDSKPVTIFYSLTTMGHSLNKVLYELAMFSYVYHPNDVLVVNNLDVNQLDYSNTVKAELQIPIDL
ncbi:MAG: winged helix-turn-helix transcriptional regulator [Candidatus Heimdallarchaeota archaeon]